MVGCRQGVTFADVDRQTLQAKSSNNGASSPLCPRSNLSVAHLSRYAEAFKKEVLELITLSPSSSPSVVTVAFKSQSAGREVAHDMRLDDWNIEVI